MPADPKKPEGMSIKEPCPRCHEQVPVTACGPSQGDCVCRCPSSCGHKWDGPFIRGANGGSMTCSGCHMPASEHDAWVLP